MPSNDMARHKKTIQQIERYIPSLRRFAYYLTRHEHDADDLIQETLSRALAGIESWQDGTNMRSWLFVIMRNTFLNEQRRSQRGAPVDGAATVDAIHEFKSEQDAKAIIQDLELALLSLPAEHREILSLVGVEGMSYEEAAEVCDISIGTVKSRLSRARKALRETLDGDDIPKMNTSGETKHG